jgi:hypothetical protein
VPTWKLWPARKAQACRLLALRFRRQPEPRERQAFAELKRPNGAEEQFGEVTAAELRQGVAVPSRLNDLHLLPGMPAEVFIQISLRSPLQYMLKPLAARQLVIF